MLIPIQAKRGYDGAYLRFTGDAILEKIENNITVEKVEETAIWELMYFGKPIE
ncbi:MAG TPA: hypothetical protein VIK72_09320 [Clostridiaceae bacterium]